MPLTASWLIERPDADIPLFRKCTTFDGHQIFVENGEASMFGEWEGKEEGWCHLSLLSSTILEMEGRLL